MPRYIYNRGEGFFFFSWKVFLNILLWSQNLLPCVGTFSFFYICFILFGVEVRRNQQISIFITLTDMFTSDGFYLAHAYYIIHNGNLIMRWMDATIHSKQMYIKWQSLSHCLLYDKEISTKLAFIWHSYISQFAKDSYPLVPTISSYFYCTDCCCHNVLPWFCCWRCYFYKNHQISRSKTHFQLS